eukprot:gene27854-12031_t
MVSVNLLDIGKPVRIGRFLGLGGSAQKEVVPRPVRIGILGASQVSTYALIWPAKRLTNVEIVAVAARDADRAADFAKQHSIPKSYGSYNELLADSDVDAVTYATNLKHDYSPTLFPNVSATWTTQALQAKKHVLCEELFDTTHFAHTSMDYAKQISRVATTLFPNVSATWTTQALQAKNGTWTSQALQANKHVLCEKPFAANEDEATQVQALATQRGLLSNEDEEPVEAKVTKEGKTLSDSIPFGALLQVIYKPILNNK